MSRGSAKDLKLEEGKLKIYGIGDFGTGKSTFASTFPTPGYVFDFDKRIASYRGKDWEYSSFGRYVREGIYDRDWGGGRAITFGDGIGME